MRIQFRDKRVDLFNVLHMIGLNRIQFFRDGKGYYVMGAVDQRFLHLGFFPVDFRNSHFMVDASGADNA